MSEVTPEATSSGTAPAPKKKTGGKEGRVVVNVHRERGETSPADQRATSSKKSEGLSGAATVLVCIAAVGLGLGGAYAVLKFTPFGKKLTGGTTTKQTGE